MTAREAGTLARFATQSGRQILASRAHTIRLNSPIQVEK